MVNLELNMTQKLDPTLEPSNYKQLPEVRMFFAESSILFQDLTSGGVLFYFAEYIWSCVVRTYTCIHVSKKSAES